MLGLFSTSKNMSLPKKLSLLLVVDFKSKVIVQKLFKTIPTVIQTKYVKNNSRLRTIWLNVSNHKVLPTKSFRFNGRLDMLVKPAGKKQIILRLMNVLISPFENEQKVNRLQAMK